MENSRKKWDDVFRDKLKNYRKEPPEEIWEGILANMNAGRSRNRVIYFRAIAAGVAILLAAGTGYYFLDHKGESSSPKSISIAQKEIRDSSADSPVDAEAIPRSENHRVAVQKGHPEEEEKEMTGRNAVHATGKDEVPARVKTALAAETGLASSSASPPLNPVPEEQFPLPEKTMPSRLKLPVDVLNHPLFAGVPVKIEDTIIRPAPEVTLPAGILLTDFELPPAEKEKTDKLFISAAFSPVYSYRSLGSEENGLSGYYADSEQPRISYSGGVSIGYQASRRLSLQTGLVYSRLGIQVNSIATFSSGMDYSGSASKADHVLFIGNSIGEVTRASGDQVILSSNNPSKDIRQDNTFTPGGNMVLDGITALPASLNLDQWFHFVEVPFMVQYKFIDRTVDLNLLGGLSTNFLLADEVILDENGDKSYFGTTGDIRKINYSGNLGLGMDIDLSKNLFFTFEPQFKYYLNSLNNHNLIISRPYYLGLYTGIRFKF